MEEEIVTRGREARILIILIYSTIILFDNFIYPLSEGYFEIKMSLFLRLIIMAFGLFAFCRENKFTGYIIINGLIVLIIILTIGILHRFKVDNILGGILYIIIPIVCYILIVKSSVYKDVTDFMEFQHRKRTKRIYHLENLGLIIMIVFYIIILNIQKVKRDNFG